MRYAFLISYDGTHFYGSQRQKSLRTVQSVLEETAEKVFGAPVRAAFSGRTDAGVHAAGQVCSFSADTSVPPEKIADALNFRLPAAICVLKSAAVPENFDANRPAKRQTYC